MIAAQTPAIEAARAAHPESFRTGVVVPGQDGIPELLATRGSNLHGIGWSADHNALYLKFSGGKVYQYTEADPAAQLHAHSLALATAESCGSYFAKHLRNNPHIVCVYIGRATDIPAERHENGDGV